MSYCEDCNAPGPKRCPKCADFHVVFGKNIELFMDHSEDYAAKYAVAMISEGKISKHFARSIFGSVRQKHRKSNEPDVIDSFLAKLPLSFEQAEAVRKAVKGKNTLITARAGSGKTHVLLCIILVLIRVLKIQKENILLLSFNRSVRENNVKDLEKKFDLKDFFGTQTFNSLAYQVVLPERGSVLGAGKGESDYIQFITQIARKHSSWKMRVKCWWYLKEVDRLSIEIYEYITSLGEEVKSYGEVLIANTLFENGIEYKYEPTYRWGEREYLPDFSFSLNGKTYILEYWGVSEKNVDPTNKGNVEYVDQIRQKRVFWEHKDVTLIEMSIDDFSAGPDDFVRKLITVLEDYRIGLHPLSEEQIAERVFERRFTTIADDILGFINYARVQRITIDQLRVQLKEPSSDPNQAKKDQIFSELAVEVFEKYMQHLEEQNLWDFNRMVEEAIKHIREKEGYIYVTLDQKSGSRVLIKDLEWILIDEFQDMSPLFFELISAIRECNPDIKSVCVGDDWQAINGFCGSDTKYMKDFDTYFEDSVVANMLTNRRSTEVVVDAGNIVMHGYGEPAQSEKVDGNIDIIAIEKQKTSNGRSTVVNGIYSRLIAIVNSYNPETTFLILYRKKSFLSQPISYLERELIKRTRNKNIRVSTIHSVKGGEADVGVIIEDHGFLYPLRNPKITQKRILGLTTEKSEMEERRLFYVAVTRAKKDLYILTTQDGSGKYVREFLEYKQELIDIEAGRGRD